MNDQALQRIEPMPASPSVEGMISLAIERGATVETLERLMAIRREVRAEQAKEAYDRALADFQAECPTIQKTAKVMNKDGRSVRYQYAPLDAIIHQVKGLLQKHGFSYSVNAKAEPTQVTAACKLTHAYGHSETSEFAVPIDKDAYMNPAQQVASALTFAKRYAFCNACGIMTGDLDDDSQGSHEPKQPAKTGANVTPPKPPTTDKGTPKTPAAPSAPATEDQRKRWLATLKPLGQAALDYAYHKGWLLPPSGPENDRTPGEPLEVLHVSLVPTTKGQADAILREIEAWMDGSLGPSEPSNNKQVTTKTPENTVSHRSSEASKRAISQSEKESGHSGASSGSPEEQSWFNAVVPIPHRGMKRDEYMKQPDTIGELYNLRHDDDQARRRLFGFLHNFEPKGWTGRDGKPRPPSDSDKKFRNDLDEFEVWYEQNHPDEMNQD